MNNSGYKNDDCVKSRVETFSDKDGVSTLFSVVSKVII